MRKFIIGFILGSVIMGIGIAFAAPGVLYDILNIEIGTDSNPVYIEIIE